MLLFLFIERLQHQKEEEEKSHLEEMSEDEYDALTEEEKARIEKKRLEIKRERMKRYFALERLIARLICYKISHQHYNTKIDYLHLLIKNNHHHHHRCCWFHLSFLKHLVFIPLFYSFFLDKSFDFTSTEKELNS